MDIQKIVIYVAGYVDECGCIATLMTRDQQLAFDWTRDNKKVGALAIFRGLTQDDFDCGTAKVGYIERHMIDKCEVCAVDGIYTNLYLNEVEKMAA